MNKSIPFFKDILKNLRKEKIKLILVTHLLIDRPEFIKSLSEIIDIALIIPKPKTINQKILDKLEGYNVVNTTREKLGREDYSISLVKKYVGKEKFVISDIGGYFAETLCGLKEHFGEQLLGVIEDTENGLKRYSKIKKIPCPIYSVARSPLKLTEDTLVAYSTVYSAERILRDYNEVLLGKKSLVIGFGKIGSRIAKDLSRKQSIVKVYDTDPIKLVYALSEGFEICTKDDYLKDVDLIFAVTGNKCLDEKKLNKLKGKVYIFSITSSDDEFNFNNFSSFNKKLFNGDLVLTNKLSEIYLTNKGEAVNFLHNAVVGNFIRLVQAEIIFDIIELINEKDGEGFLELSEEKRKLISKTWLKYFYYSKVNPKSLNSSTLL
jgi:adenosylhomocysteinase